MSLVLPSLEAIIEEVPVLADDVDLDIEDEKQAAIPRENSTSSLPVEHAISASQFEPKLEQSTAILAAEASSVPPIPALSPASACTKNACEENMNNNNNNNIQDNISNTFVVSPYKHSSQSIQTTTTTTTITQAPAQQNQDVRRKSFCAPGGFLTSPLGKELHSIGVGAACDINVPAFATPPLPLINPTLSTANAKKNLTGFNFAGNEIMLSTGATTATINSGHMRGHSLSVGSGSMVASQMRGGGSGVVVVGGEQEEESKNNRATKSTAPFQFQGILNTSTQISPDISNFAALISTTPYLFFATPNMHLHNLEASQDDLYTVFTFLVPNCPFPQPHSQQQQSHHISNTSTSGTTSNNYSYTNNQFGTTQERIPPTTGKHLSSQQQQQQQQQSSLHLPPSSIIPQKLNTSSGEVIQIQMTPQLQMNAKNTPHASSGFQKTTDSRNTPKVPMFGISSSSKQQQQYQSSASTTTTTHEFQSQSSKGQSNQKTQSLVDLIKSQCANPEEEKKKKNGSGSSNKTQQSQSAQSLQQVNNLNGSSTAGTNSGSVSAPGLSESSLASLYQLSMNQLSTIHQFRSFQNMPSEDTSQIASNKRVKSQKEIKSSQKSLQLYQNQKPIKQLDNQPDDNPMKNNNQTKITSNFTIEPSKSEAIEIENEAEAIRNVIAVAAAAVAAANQIANGSYRQTSADPISQDDVVDLKQANGATGSNAGSGDEIGEEQEEEDDDNEDVDEENDSDEEARLIREIKEMKAKKAAGELIFNGGDGGDFFDFCDEQFATGGVGGTSGGNSMMDGNGKRSKKNKAGGGAHKNKFDTKNLVKNFLNSFISFVHHPDEEAHIVDVLAFDGMEQLNDFRSNLRNFFKGQKFNRVLLKDFIFEDVFRPLFLFFLENRALTWIQSGRMKDKASHLRALKNFIFVCQNYDQIKSWRFRYNFVSN